MAIINYFSRNFNSGKLSQLQKSSSPLWEKLITDCKAGKVFPAIRNNEIDFYYQGSKLFGYKNEKFKTHIKYAAVIDGNNDYLTEDELKNCVLIKDYAQGYDRIKENCKNYSGVEALGVAALYHKYNYVNCSKGVVVLDIEVSFGGPDRVDILLYNLKNKELMFVEAKHYSNPELWATGVPPKVCNQIKRYDNCIEKYESNILGAYTEYVSLVNQIFNLKLDPPAKIAKETKLYIFGFGNDEKQGRLQKLIYNNPAFNDIAIYAKGNATSANANTLWKKNHN